MPANPAVDHARASRLISAAIIVTAIYVGREMLLPFAIAVLLSFLLAPLVERLEALRFGRIPAIMTVVVTALAALVLLAVVLAGQIYDLADKLPGYKQNIVAKLQPFQGQEEGVFSRAAKAIDEIRTTLSGPRPASEEQERRSVRPESTFPRPDTSMLQEESSPERSSPVEVTQTLSTSQIAQGMLGPIVVPFTTAAMVTVFVIFMLLKREDLRNRFIQLVGGELSVTTQALDDAASRVSRYLLMQLIINAVYGVVIGVGLLLIGLPNAVLWAVLTALLRFVPFLGPWIAALMTMAISLAVFDGWMQPLLVLALFIVNELVSNNVLEPWLYGASTGISTLGILVSAVFWTWMWGPAGLIMATPLTVCVAVIGRYVPQLTFLNIMLSNEDALAPHARFYQRLLAADPEEAIEVADEYLTTHPLVSLYDDVLLPALSLAEHDRHHGKLEEEKQQLFYQTIRGIVEESGDRVNTPPIEASSEAKSATGGDAAKSRRVLCLPARDDADELAGLMLVQLLQQQNVAARVVPTTALGGDIIELIDDESTTIVCVSALPPFAVTPTRVLCRKLRERFPRLQLIVGVWQLSNVTAKSKERLNAIGIDQLVRSLGEAVESLEGHIVSHGRGP